MESMNCRSPHGERGLKSAEIDLYLGHLGRSPHGERGLKCGLIEYEYKHRAVALLTESVD